MATEESRIEEADAFALAELTADVHRLREELERITGIEAPMVIFDPRNERIYVVPTEHLPKWLNAACGETAHD